MTAGTATGRELAWTGGQYSLFRALLGLYLLVHFVHLLPWSAEVFSSSGMIDVAGKSPLVKLFPNVLLVCDAPWFVTGFVGAGALASGLLLIGAFDRGAALVVWYVWACLLGRNPLISNPGLPYVGWILLAHATMPISPFGSWQARDRVDPDGGWRFPPIVFAGAWILLALGYGYSGITKLVSPSWVDGSAFRHLLENPLARDTWLRAALLATPPFVLKAATWAALAAELAFPLLALSRRTRPIAWTALFALHLGLFVLVDFADLTLGMVMVHLFTFDPAWLPARRTKAASTAYDTDVGATNRASDAPTRVFFDGGCALCHRLVRFVLAECRNGVFVFSPLQGSSAARAFTAEQRARLPDSVVVQTADGRVLLRSSGVLRVLDSLGGAWRVLAWIFRVIPRPLRDLGYDLVARVRYRIFGRKSGSCPLMPPRSRHRFEA